MAKRPFEQLVRYPARTGTGHYGRNGCMQGHGIAVRVYGDECQLKPIVARDYVSGAARISVPFDQLDAVIAALVAVRDGD